MLVLGFAAPTSAQTRPDAIAYADGSVGTSNTECGAGDLCASLTSADGTRLEIYNEAAGHCEPYALRIVKMRGDAALFNFERKTNLDVQDSGMGQPCKFENTTLTFDNGAARLLFYLNGDGALSARWQGP